jgi:hypothetical protein
MTVLIKIGLGLLLVDELVVGGWNAIWPEGFYRHFPTVDLIPPFNEHYARDFGGATLGIALLLGLAFVKPKAHFAIPAALAYSVFSVPHFLYHVTNLEGATLGEAVALTAANAAVAVLGILVVVLTVARDRRVLSQRTEVVSAGTRS